MAYHADDEKLWGDNPTIASISFGANRRFLLKSRRTGERVSVDLEHGSLLVMAGSTQHNWNHAVPKTQVPVDRRINLTYRRLA
jgi:alkylated DNA repair dioxygenase AlkB